MAKKTNQKTTMEEQVAELARILTDDPSMEQKICKTIEYHLKKGIDDETYLHILSSLNILIGAKARRLVVDSCKANRSEFFQDIKKQVEVKGVDKVLPFLQYLTALYGPEMEKAYGIYGEESDDWTSAGVTALREGRREKTWLIELELTKNNGEKVYLRMPPWSTLTLVRRFLREIGMVPKEVISEEAIKRFNEETRAFQEKFLGIKTARTE